MAISQSLVQLAGRMRGGAGSGRVNVGGNMAPPAPAPPGPGPMQHSPITPPVGGGVGIVGGNMTPPNGGVVPHPVLGGDGGVGLMPHPMPLRTSPPPPDYSGAHWAGAGKAAADRAAAQPQQPAAPAPVPMAPVGAPLPPPGLQGGLPGIGRSPLAGRYGF